MDIKINHKKNCIYISLSLIIIFSSVSGYLLNFQITSPAFQLVSSPSSAQIVENTIFINETDPNHNWDDYGFITGVGSLADPYYIEDLIIEIDGQGNGIFIINSDKSLIIKNCIILHKNEISSDKLMTSIGIYFKNCTNFRVKGCSVIQNSYGILLSNTSGIIIEDSTFNHNKMVGIYSNYSSNNHFYTNNISRNSNTGFLLDSSNENSLRENIIAENYYFGIYLKNSDNNIIHDNYIQDNGKRNVVNENSITTNYSGNTRKEQWIDGFIIELSSVLLVTAYVIYKHSKHDKINKDDKEIKKNMETKEING